MTTLGCLDRELSTRGLTPSADFRAELRQLCIEPLNGQLILWERLLKGCTVLDAHGGAQAPDQLWERWEALFAAWCCTQEAMHELRLEAERRDRRNRQVTTPHFNWKRN